MSHCLMVKDKILLITKLQFQGVTESHISHISSSIEDIEIDFETLILLNLKNYFKEKQMKCKISFELSILLQYTQLACG